jgi:hypothetical protein
MFVPVYQNELFIMEKHLAHAVCYLGALRPSEQKVLVASGITMNPDILF